MLNSPSILFHILAFFLIFGEAKYLSGNETEGFVGDAAIECHVQEGGRDELFLGACPRMAMSRKEEGFVFPLHVPGTWEKSIFPVAPSSFNLVDGHLLWSDSDLEVKVDIQAHPVNVQFTNVGSFAYWVQARYRFWKCGYESTNTEKGFIYLGQNPSSSDHLELLKAADSILYKGLFVNQDGIKEGVILTLYLADQKPKVLIQWNDIANVLGDARRLVEADVSVQDGLVKFISADMTGTFYGDQLQEAAVVLRTTRMGPQYCDKALGTLLFAKES